MVKQKYEAVSNSLVKGKRRKPQIIITKEAIATLFLELKFQLILFDVRK